jgi:hypothetical protein
MTPVYTTNTLKLIALCFGLSHRDFNITDHDNRATAGAAADSSFQDAVLPMALNITNHLEMEVVDFYYPGYIMKLTDTEPRTEKEEADSAVQLFINKIITQNEARQRVGDETIPEGDKFFDGGKPDGPSDQQAMKQKLDEQQLKHGELTLKERQQQMQQNGSNGQNAFGSGKPNQLKSFQLARRPSKTRDYSAELDLIDLEQILGGGEEEAS